MGISGPVVAAVALVVLAACSSDGDTGDTGGAGAGELRRVAVEAGDDPTDCPYDLDLSGALADAGAPFTEAVLDEVEVETSARTEPADDPAQAQRDGASALDAAAGTFVSCSYAVGERNARVLVTTAGGDGTAAALLLLPQVQAEADLDVDAAEAFAGDLDGGDDGGDDGGGARLAPGGTVALAVVPLETGSAAVMVTGGAVTEQKLAEVTDDLADDLEAAAG